MGANVLTGLIPTLYQAVNVVSREQSGFVAAVSLNAEASMAAKDEPIRIPIVPPAVAADIVPSVTPPDTGDQTLGYVDMTISKSRAVPIRWNGEQQKGMRNAGTINPVFKQQVAEAVRTLINEVEYDLWVAAYQGASRAYGTPGTAPFGTSGDISDAAAVAKILDDNGAPGSDRHLVLGSAGVFNLRGKQGLVLKANENGSNSFRETGRLSDIPLVGFDLHNSFPINQVTKGTGASYVTSGSTAKGVNTIALVTGTGTVLAGDVVTFQADTDNKYVVNAGVTAPGTITIGSPGARKTIATANALTVGNSYTPNVAFHRSAIQLVTRAPAIPLNPDGSPADMAIAREVITDPLSGISFEFAVYAQHRQVQYSVGLAWGVCAVKADHIAVLQG